MDVNQHYLFEARQMQALSLAVHIPLVCFGIAFPVLVLVAEWRYLRTGDELYRTLARRWSRIMLALFAVGVVTGTILSFELGLLWPVWMQDFGNVFGLGFTLEGFSFFLEAIFIGIYAYGWDRLKPRLHFLSGIPIAVAGVAGSLFVIAVNGWMNHPTGFTLVDGKAADVHPWSALFANPHDEITSTPSLYSMLSTGNRYSVLPALAASEFDLSKFVFRELRAPSLSREVCLITRQLRALSSSSERFLRFLRDTMRNKPIPAGVRLFTEAPTPTESGRLRATLAPRKR